MKINFTKKEYRQLLEMVYLGDMVAGASSEDASTPYDQLREKIYSYAKDFGCDDWIRYDASLEKYTETVTFEEGRVMRLLEIYDAYIQALADEFGRD